MRRTARSFRSGCWLSGARASCGHFLLDQFFVDLIHLCGLLRQLLAEIRVATLCETVWMPEEAFSAQPCVRVDCGGAQETFDVVPTCCLPTLSFRDTQARRSLAHRLKFRPLLCSRRKMSRCICTPGAVCVERSLSICANPRHSPICFAI